MDTLRLKSVFVELNARLATEGPQRPVTPSAQSVCRMWLVIYWPFWSEVFKMAGAVSRDFTVCRVFYIGIRGF